MNATLSIAPVQPKRLLSHYHDVRRRLMSPPVAQAIKRPVEPEPIAVEPPPDRPDDGFIRRYVEAAATAYEVSYDDVLSGLPTHNIALARRLAVALAHVWGINPVAKVAKAFGVDTTTVIDAAADLSAILRQRMISTNTPFEAVIPVIMNEWEVYSSRQIIPSIERIIAVASRYFGISQGDMRSASRLKRITRPRQITMAVCHRLTSCGSPTIGRKFGGKDHTTVLHALRLFKPLIDNVDKRIGGDASITTWIDELVKELERTPLGPRKGSK